MSFLLTFECVKLFTLTWAPWTSCKFKTLPKAQRTRGLSSYHKFLHISWSNLIFRISTKHQLQNLNQTSASRLNLNFKILTKPSFRISTKIQPHNFNQTSAAKYWRKFIFNLTETSTSKSSTNFVLNIRTKNYLEAKTSASNSPPKLLSTRFSATVTTSTSIELASSNARVTSIKFTKQEWVSQWVS